MANGAKSDGIVRRDRSYWLQEDMEGITVETTEPTYASGEVPVGTRGVVISRSNAGFNGILASIRTPDGKTIHNLSAGLLKQVQRESDHYHYYKEWENGRYLGVSRHEAPLAPEEVAELAARGVVVRETTDPRDRF